MIVGAGDSACVVLAVGAGDRSTSVDWGATPSTKLRCGTMPASLGETTDAGGAYARFGRGKLTG